MIVVADTSPLNYLILIGAVDLLPSLYGSIYTAPACVSELTAPGAPEEVRRWFENRPGWMVTTAPEEVNDPRLAHLDWGEREAISLALQLRADLVLILMNETEDWRQKLAVSVSLVRFEYWQKELQSARSISRKLSPGCGARPSAQILA